MTSRSAGSWPAGTNGRSGGDVAAGGGGERLLDQPVLERVVGLDDHAAADGDARRSRPAAPGGARASSSLTSIRSAWKVRLAGWPPVRRAGAGIAAYSSSTSRAEVVNGCGLALADDGAGDLAGEPLLAVLAQDPGQVGGRVGVEDVGGGRAACVPSIRMSSGASSG